MDFGLDLASRALRVAQSMTLTVLKCVMRRLLFASAVVAMTVFNAMPVAAQTAPAPAAEAPQASTGPLRLRQPSAPEMVPAPAVPAAPMAQPTRAGEFETFVKLERFGADMVNELASGAADFSPIVPADYIMQPGDEIQLTLWGSLDADLRLTVDRAGRVSIPRVGPVLVAGSRYGDLHDLLARRVSVVFKNFELSASLGRLRGVRVYVTGFVQRPGAYVVSGLSTVMNAVMRAGGPSASGSFRQVELRRGDQVVASFDLYALLLRGDRSGDRVVQPDDVIHVAPVGPQVALRGSVNRAAVFELKAGDTLKEVLAMAGGFNAVADRTRVALERLDERKGERVVQLQLPASATAQLSNGDVIRVFSAVEASLSGQLQNKRVRVDGEVANPGEYVLPPQSTLADALRAAGGLTHMAYVYGAQFIRESVRATQQENYDRALRDLETDFARAAGSQRVASPEEAATQAARSAATTRLLDRLRALQPGGRVVLQLAPDSSELPNLVLEDGDRLYVPPKPSSVGVFGSVFNAGSYLFTSGRTLDDYLRLAGGPTKGADEASVFVIRANGTVESARQSGSWLNRGGRLGGTQATPGDTVFVPEEMDKTTALQTAKDWTLLLYQLGVGAAGIKSAIR